MFFLKDIMEEDENRALLQEESLFSQLSRVCASETGPVLRGQTQAHSPLGLVLMNAFGNTLLTAEAVSPSRSCLLSSHVNKRLAPEQVDP